MPNNNKYVLSYIERDSVVHRLTGTAKLLVFFFFTLAVMITYDTRVLLVLLMLSAAAFALSKIKFSEIKSVIIFTLIFLVLNNFFIYVFAPEQGVAIYGTRHELLHLFGRYSITAEQLFYTLNISLKYFAALPMALLFISTTNPSEFAASLNSVGVSYRVAYSIAIALRYIPDIQRDYREISMAQQARGVELGGREPLFKRLKNSINILMPLIMSSLSRIDSISNAMELRGFGKNKRRTWYMHRRFKALDWLSVILAASLLAGTIYMIFQNHGRFYNPFV